MQNRSRNYWVISDTHFSHAGILGFTDRRGNPVREFDDVSHMNETMIDNWNRVVQDGDYVYHLGDVAFGGEDQLSKIMPRLKGKKSLVVGNHDNIKRIAAAGVFRKIELWKMWKDFDLVMTHVPLHMAEVGNHYEKYNFNVHGHIHTDDSPTDRHVNVCVEKINYTPINLETLADRVKKIRSAW